LAFSSFAFRDALRFFPARLMKNVNMRIPELGPFGETFFDASSRAMVSGSLVNNPSRGYVDVVFTLPDHFFALMAMFILPGLVGSILDRQCGQPNRTGCVNYARLRSVFLEVLHLAFVLFCGAQCRKCSQVAALACLRVLLP
jgi:hypothetical protein